MTTVTFHPLAEREYHSARRWYAEQSPEAAGGFRDAVDSLLERITSDPQLFPHWGRSASRWGRAKRFPYILIFRVLTVRLQFLWAGLKAVAGGSDRRRRWFSVPSLRDGGGLWRGEVSAGTQDRPFSATSPLEFTCSRRRPGTFARRCGVQDSTTTASGQHRKLEPPTCRDVLESGAATNLPPQVARDDRWELRLECGGRVGLR